MKSPTVRQMSTLGCLSGSSVGKEFTKAGAKKKTQPWFALKHVPPLLQKHNIATALDTHGKVIKANPMVIYHLSEGDIWAITLVSKEDTSAFPKVIIIEVCVKSILYNECSLRQKIDHLLQNMRGRRCQDYNQRRSHSIHHFRSLGFRPWLFDGRFEWKNYKSINPTVWHRSSSEEEVEVVVYRYDSQPPARG